ncbi:hypothetical protein FH593_03065 [Leptospira interrogans]|nr:hypothetical protein [Leptospira interrogans]ALO01826.1 hypothetical protein LIH_15900 [Leptospira interrogans serovar Hardjo-prajitno]MCH1904191.1 hypothetical protein [Leptospira interrogans]OOB94823.1 hypothetical protein B0191_10030 [Leptospira interrogans serovar Hardjo]OOB97583.1 hypothetical protein B0192_16015 [Leptospira interrogans serovar Australis]ULG84100.1 hypothetical protein FH594_17665 [Leptospira interrogans]
MIHLCSKTIIFRFYMEFLEMLIGNPAKRINSEIKVLNENIFTVVENIHLHPMFLLNRQKRTQRKF